MPRNPFLFTRHHVRQETEESDPITILKLMLGRLLKLWMVLKSPTLSYTPSTRTLQLQIFNKQRFLQDLPGIVEIGNQVEGRVRWQYI